MDKKTVTIWVVIVVVGLIIASFLLWQNFSKQDSQEEELTPPPESDLPTESKPEDVSLDSPDWQIYRDTERGFQFSYPNGLVANRDEAGEVVTFTLSESSRTSLRDSEVEMKVSLWDKSGSENLRDFVTQIITPEEVGDRAPVYSGPGPLTDQENLYVVRSMPEGKEFHYYFAFPESDQILDFATANEDFAAQDLVAVVSSLLFLDEESPADTSEGEDWLSFEDPQQSFSVKYPPGWTTGGNRAAEGGSYYIDFLPPGSSASSQSGTISIWVLPNPDGLSLEDFYGQPQWANLFQDAGEISDVVVGDEGGKKFSQVSGLVPSTIVSLRNEDKVFEIHDVGSLHQEDGVFDQMVSQFTIL